MAKMKKRKLRWKASESQQVVGYRLYWAESGEVGYDSSFTALGNVTEVVLPDDVDGFSPKGGPIEFGVSAVDELGNESDLITFQAPYQFNIPLAPEELWIESLDEFHTEGEEPDAEKPPEPIALFAKNGDTKEETDGLAKSSERDKTDRIYPTVQHYGQPDNNRKE